MNRSVSCLMLGSMGVADRVRGMQIYCRCSIGPRDFLKSVVFWGKMHIFFNNLRRRLRSVHKVGGAQPPQVSSWGCSSTHSPPGSYVPGRDHVGLPRRLRGGMAAQRSRGSQEHCCSLLRTQTVSKARQAVFQALDND